MPFLFPQWLQAYLDMIRPGYSRGDCDKFFLSSNGKGLNSVTNDIARLHERFVPTYIHVLMSNVH